MSLFIETEAQSKMVINQVCSYYGEKTSSSAYTFTSDKEALTALKLITDASGISQNFTLLAADIPNAAAVIMYNKRYILYNQTFMYNISQRINYWASLSILAHEVGHHLNGHSLIPGGSRPSLELQADKFSGFILAKIGASLEEAQSAINAIVSENGSTTHPGKSARLAAIANGWYENNSKNNSKISNVKKPSEIFCGDPSVREQIFIKKVNNASYKIVSEKGYEFRNSEYRQHSVNDNLRIFWFPDYTAYGYIQDFNEIEEQKFYQLKRGNCTAFIGDKLNKGNALIVYFPNNQFYIIYDGNKISDASYVNYEEENLPGYGKIRRYYYKFNYGSNIINVIIDPDLIESSVNSNKILVDMGILVN